MGVPELAVVVGMHGCGGEAAQVNADPKVRKDGRCAQCRKPRATVTAAMRKYAGDQIDRDPFCSMACCRKWHGCELPKGELSRYPKQSFGAVIPDDRCLGAASVARYRAGCRCEDCRAVATEDRRRRRYGTPEAQERTRVYERARWAKRKAAA